MSATQARIKLALPHSNTAGRIVKVKVPKGTPYIEGMVASQETNARYFGPYAVGGGKQFYFLDEHKSVMKVIEDISNSKK